MGQNDTKKHNSHDLELPSWGPYSKTHLGVSHIADAEKGLRFDLVPSLGFYRGKICIPSALWDSDARPTFARPDLSHFRTVHEIAGRDRVTAAIDYKQDKDQVDVTARFDNRSPEPVACTLRSFASLQFPNERVRDASPLCAAKPRLPAGSSIIDATHYDILKLADPLRRNGIVSDAKRRGVFRESGFVTGCGLGPPFGFEGDEVQWHVQLPSPLQRAQCSLRYRAGRPVTIRMRFTALNGSGPAGNPPGATTATVVADLLPATILELRTLDLDTELSAGAFSVSLEVLTGSALELDCLVLSQAVLSNSGESGASSRLAFETLRPVAKPKIGVVTSGAAIEPARSWWQRSIEKKREARGITLDYEEIEGVYLVLWNRDGGRVRTIHHSEIDFFIRKLVQEHVTDELIGDKRGHFTDIALEPIAIPAGNSYTISMRTVLCSADEVEEHIGRFEAQVSKSEPIPVEKLPGDSISDNLRKQGRDALAATLLTNIVYPIHTKWGYIRHNTPGRWWDSLYTWDSGFIGIGLSAIDFARAKECLLAYLTDPDDPDAPYVQHGTPLPVQIYLFRELWNRYHDEKLERHAYPGLKRMYDFLVGRATGSPTQPFASGLVTTWELFYNSGGWDDYPPQVYVHHAGLTGRVAPVVSTSHAIRSARILRNHAERLGFAEDIAQYTSDIDRLTEALQRYAWDEPSGFFGYVEHDESGHPVGILRHEGGENFNRGLDGLSPFVAGACSVEQRERTVELLMSPQRIWSDIGLSTVDQSAACFRSDGYWNGAVWMPHQWFFWKSLIDYGYLEEALKVAETALDLWGREAGESGRCFEHFPIAGGRGAGWHQFGGLSAPVLPWYQSLHGAGTITPGYDVRVDDHRFDPERGRLEARVSNDSPESRWILVCLGEASEAKELFPESFRSQARKIAAGVFAVELPGQFEGTITVRC